MPFNRASLRSRLPFLGLALLTIPSGLALRYCAPILPHVLRKEGADALSATLVYFIVRTLWPGRSARMRAAAGAVAFSFAVELSQLYHEPWIDRIRATTLGGLTLGHGFHAADLVAYVIGVGLGLLAEACLQRTASWLPSAPKTARLKTPQKSKP